MRKTFVKTMDWITFTFLLSSTAVRTAEQKWSTKTAQPGKTFVLENMQTDNGSKRLFENRKAGGGRHSRRSLTVVKAEKTC